LILSSPSGALIPRRLNASGPPIILILPEWKPSGGDTLKEITSWWRVTSIEPSFARMTG